MAGYTRVDTGNNIADGNVISAADLDNEFDGIQAAFNASTGHNHDGTTGEGAPILVLGPTQDVTISSSTILPKISATVDIGSSSLKFRELHLSGLASIDGTLSVTGVTTFTAQPVLSSLTANQAVFTNGTKGLVSNAITGTGNVVMSTSPTLVTPDLGTPSSAILTNATGLPVATGISGLAAGVAAFLTTPSSSNLATVVTDETGTGALVFANSPTLVSPALGTPSSGTVTNLTGTASININGTVGATTPNTGAFTTLTTSGTVTHNGGTANSVAYLNGSKVLTTGSALTFDGTSLNVNTAGMIVDQATLGSVNIIHAKKGDNVDFSRSPVVLIENTTATGSINHRAGLLFNAYNSSNASTSAEMRWESGAGLAWYLNASENMRLTSTGLGIGTSSPLSKLHVVGDIRVGSAGRVLFFNSGNTSYGYIGAPSTDSSLAFYTNSEAMRLDSSGNVGIGTSSPGYKLSIATTTGGGMNMSNGVDSTLRVLLPTAGITYDNVNYGYHAWLVGGSEKMRISDSGNVGIGTSSPDTKVHAYNAASNTWFRAQSGGDNSTGLYMTNSQRSWLWGVSGGGAGAMYLYDLTGSKEVLNISASGNLGLGVTPSAWGSNYKAIESQGNSAFAIAGANVNGITIASNAYATNAGWLYKTTGPASYYNPGASGIHQWFTAPSGTAGNAISFTQAMTLDASGRLGIGATSLTEYLTVKSPNASTFFSLQTATDSGVFMGNNGGALTLLTGSTERARFDSSGSFLFPNSTGTRPGSSGQYIVVSTAFYQQSGGNYYLVTTAGGSTSDATLKTNVQQLSGALEKVCAIRGVSFEFIEEPMCTADKGTQLGVIAQEVEAQYPEIVLTDENGIKTVRYDRLVAPLIEAVKEQQAIITALTARVAALESN